MKCQCNNVSRLIFIGLISIDPPSLIFLMFTELRMLPKFLLPACPVLHGFQTRPVYPFWWVRVVLVVPNPCSGPSHPSFVTFLQCLPGENFEIWHFYCILEASPCIFLHNKSDGPLSKKLHFAIQYFRTTKLKWYSISKILCWELKKSSFQE